MAHRMVSHPPLTLALVLLLVSALVGAVPMGPLMGFFGPSLLGHGAGYGGSKMGMSYSCGASFGSCANKHDRYDMVYVEEPKLMTAVSRRVLPGGELEAMTVVIEDSTASTNGDHGQGDGAFGYGQNLGYGGGHAGLGGFGGGFGGYGSYGGMGYGLMGALGGFGLLGGMQEPRLDLELVVVISEITSPVKVLVVFTEAVDPDSCTLESLGHVLTGSEHSEASQGGYGGGGYASPYMMQGGGPYGGQPGDSLAMEREFGVIAQLQLKTGSNTFTIKGLGDITRFNQLAGRGIALCHDVVMGLGGKSMCTGDVNTFVHFCAKLRYSIKAPSLFGPS